MVRRHTDKNCNNRKNKPAVQLHTQGPLRFQFLLELALANTQTEPSERLAARCISDNAYSPPAPETSDPSCKGSRKLSNPLHIGTIRKAKSFGNQDGSFQPSRLNSATYL